MIDPRIRESGHLTPADIVLLERIAACMPITADVCRADLLLCILLPDGRALVANHGLPDSISSLYQENATGRTFTAEDQPLILRALHSGSGGRRQGAGVRNGAPIIQDVYPVSNQYNRVIAAFQVETNMIAHERQKRRNRHFRRATNLLLEMCLRGELEGAGALTRFGLYDGIYLVDRARNVIYMSGIAANLFRTIGVQAQHNGQPLSSLESLDRDLVERVMAEEHCVEVRSEAEDGRTWIRRGIPLAGPSQLWRSRWFALPLRVSTPSPPRRVEQVLVLIHNATEAVAKQRELNVKSALIQEVHHRVKNNLQNIAAILRMQARRTSNDETRQHLTDAVNRVLSMSVIHEFLGQEENRSINVRDVCQRIANQVREVARNPEQQITIQVTGPSIRLPASQATPAAMVMNELLLNALEHGIKQRQSGEISVTLSDLGDAVQLEVQDDGDGLPPDFALEQSSSLGLQIVRTLVKDDLKGALRFTSGSSGDGLEQMSENGPGCGVRAIVIFPKRPPNSD
jgi:two-component sensor histidine kinase